MMSGDLFIWYMYVRSLLFMKQNYLEINIVQTEFTILTGTNLSYLSTSEALLFIKRQTPIAMTTFEV